MNATKLKETLVRLVMFPFAVVADALGLVVIQTPELKLSEAELLTRRQRVVEEVSRTREV